MTQPITAPRCTLRFSRRVPQLSPDLLGQCQLVVGAGAAEVQVACFSATDNRCLLLESYGLPQPAQGLGPLLQALYQQHETLQSLPWQAVTICVDSPIYTLVPSQWLDPTHQEDYLKLACTVPPDIFIQHHTHSFFQVSLLFGIETKWLETMQAVHKNKPLRVLHRGSAIIEGTWKYYHSLGAQKDPKAFAFVTPTHLHVVVLLRNKLFYYNQFTYQNSDELLNYLMISLYVIEFDLKSQEVLFLGHIGAAAAAYQKAATYIRHINLATPPKQIIEAAQFDKLDKETCRTYFDVLSTPWCSSTS